MRINFSIVIPSRGVSQSLVALLRSLEKIDDIQACEVLVIFNPPNPRNLIVDQFPQLRLRQFQCEVGVNRARNLGQQMSLGDYILFLDDDCEVSDSSLLLHHEHFHRTRPWAFAIGGFYRNLNSDRLSKAYAGIQENWLRVNKLSSDGEAQCLLGGHFSIKNSANLPLFDETIIYGGSETEYFFRLKKMGYRFQLIDQYVDHRPSLGFWSFLRKAYKQGFTKSRLVRAQEGLEPIWVGPTEIDRDLFVRIYNFVFNFGHEKSSFISNIILKIKLRLILLNQKICFYLENRELF